MTTKATFITALGGAKLTLGLTQEFTCGSTGILAIAAHGLETGAGPYKVMTTNDPVDPPAGLVAAELAKAIYTANIIVLDDTVTIDGKTYTFKDAPNDANDGEVTIITNDTITVANLERSVNLIVPNSGFCSQGMKGNKGIIATVKDIALTVFARTLDASIGNAIAVSESSAGSWDNPTLTGGVSGTDYFVIKLTDDTLSLATSKINALAGTAQTITDTGTGVHRLVATTDTLADAMEDVLINFMTHPGTRVLPSAFNIAKFWQSCIDGSAAGDQA